MIGIIFHIQIKEKCEQPGVSISVNEKCEQPGVSCSVKDKSK